MTPAEINRHLVRLVNDLMDRGRHAPDTTLKTRYLEQAFVLHHIVEHGHPAADVEFVRYGHHPQIADAVMDMFPLMQVGQAGRAEWSDVVRLVAEGKTVRMRPATALEKHTENERISREFAAKRNAVEAPQ